jgi:hypothetical protein
MISRLPPENGASETDEVRLLVSNGDLDLASDAVERLGFKDLESLLRFAIIVLSKSATRQVTVTTADGQTASYSPKEPLLADNTTNTKTLEVA